MIVGPGHDDTSMCDVVEDLGGLVVDDLTCFGGKVIFGAVSEDGPDPLRALADYQVLARPLCPKNLSAHALINKEVLGRVRDLRVDGVIGQVFLCCDTWGGEIYLLNKELREAGTPLLRIERECTSDSTGQLRTRVQAFIETVSGGAP
jgi:benzoyl-CoA reductase/2-hydroxyglutaryl-CoA dehydratase subunit BcrC/BadD/HgdB